MFLTQTTVGIILTNIVRLIVTLYVAHEKGLIIMRNKTWFITGASKGFGLALVKELLTQGYQVAATTRDIKKFNKTELQNENFLPLQLKSLTDSEEVAQAISTTIAQFEHLDVVVNNAGYGQFGAFEEISDKKIRENFEVNVFGTMNVTRAVLPYFRQQKSGHIVNFSSTAGFYGFPLSSIYVAAKHAINGYSESLSGELKPFGIHVTCVFPGVFRTNFFSQGSLNWEDLNNIADYDLARQNQKKFLSASDRQQKGNPTKGRQVLIQAVNSDTPPTHLLLGSDAYQLADKKMELVKDELASWHSKGTDTNFES